MQLRWTSTAADDLEINANYLFDKTPENATHLIREIYNAQSLPVYRPRIGHRNRPVLLSRQILQLNASSVKTRSGFAGASICSATFIMTRYTYRTPRFTGNLLPTS